MWIRFIYHEEDRDRDWCTESIESTPPRIGERLKSSSAVEIGEKRKPFLVTNIIRDYTDFVRRDSGFPNPVQRIDVHCSLIA